MFKKEIKYKDIIIAIVISCLLVFVGIKLINNSQYFFNIAKKIFSLSVPFIYALIIAYILNPLVKLFEKKFKLNKGISILITYSILVGVLVLIGYYCVPSIIQSLVDLSSSIPNYITEAQTWLNNLFRDPQIKEIISNTELMDHANKIIAQMGTLTINILEGVVLSVFSISTQIIKIGLGILISVYVLVDKERLIRETKKILYVILREKNAKSAIELVKNYNNMVVSYIGIKAIDSSIIAVMAFVLLTLVKSEYVLLLSIAVGITNMIPYFGPFVGEIIGFLFNVFISPTKAIIVFLVLLALQQFDGWYLDPKLIGKKVGVRPIFIIFAVVIGGGFFGPIGMLLASPTVATINIYYDRFMDKNKELTKGI
ncbi:AI-2E family transporter [Clostridium sp.]|uniref:AI-2E family transporter n=1 Tax=Clostridium sp. TaxID=1506 RepID=UPI003F303981